MPLNKNGKVAYLLTGTDIENKTYIVNKKHCWNYVTL